MNRLVRNRANVTVIVALAGAAALATACLPAELPGEVVGTFKVTGFLEQNSCGIAAIPAENPMVFAVEIRDDRGVGVWAVAKQPFVYGVLNSEGEFAFSQQSRVAIDQRQTPSANPDEEVYEWMNEQELEAGDSSASCILERVETVKGRIERQRDDEPPDAGRDDELPDAGGDEATGALRGDNTIEIFPAPGSDCTASTSAAGGPFLALPCRIHYSLQGVRQ